MESAQISISIIRKVIARVPVFGIDFNKAILSAVRNGNSTAHFYSPKVKKWGDLGTFADFLIKINKNKEKLLVFQAWQAIEKEETLFFVHGILSRDLKYFTHIDFAYHYTSLDEIQKLIHNGEEKPILSSKEKILRLDGQIPFDTGFELMRAFFPIDNLVDEYYQRTEQNFF